MLPARKDFLIGTIGWGEGHISPGSSSKTRDSGWARAKPRPFIAHHVAATAPVPARKWSRYRARHHRTAPTLVSWGPNAHSAANEWVAALAQRLRDVET